MRNVFRLGLRLLAVALAAGLLLGLTDYFTQEPIAAQRVRMAEEARLQAYQEANSFQEMTDVTLTGDITGVYQAQKNGKAIGYVVSVAPKGYGGPVNITVGVDLSGSVVGVVMGSNSETPGLGKRVSEPKFNQQFVGKSGIFSLQDDGNTKVDAITGATISSRAVTNGMNQAVAMAEQLAKGE